MSDRRSDGAVLDTFVSRHRDALYADLRRRRDEAAAAWSRESFAHTTAIQRHGERSGIALRTYQALQSEVSKWEHRTA